MSLHFERRIRRVVITLAGFSLLGVSTAGVDYWTSRESLAATDDGTHSATFERQLPGRGHHAAKPLDAAAESLFKVPGKQNRADYVTARKAGNAKPQFVTASLDPGEMAHAPKPAPAVYYEVNRSIKGDRLALPQMARLVQPAEESANVGASAAVFVVAPPLADAEVAPGASTAGNRPVVSADAMAGTHKDEPVAVASASPDAMEVVRKDEPAATASTSPDAKEGEHKDEPLATASASADAAAGTHKDEPVVASTSVDAMAGTRTGEPAAATASKATDDKVVSAADQRPTGKSAWDELVKLASVKSDTDDKATIFGGMSEKEFRAQELRCMAIAVYFEARDEPLRGQIAVAQVIMTRVRSEFYPKTICGVVYQGQMHRNSCQFSFACDGKTDVPTEKKEWATALDVARQVISGKVYLKDIADATHYHATYVHPDWVKLVKRVKQIGGHIFYKASFAPPLVANADYSKL